MDKSPEVILNDELENGEQLLWAGRPRQGIIFRSIDILVIPFTLLWLGMAVYWELGVLQGNFPVFFAIWGAFFVLIGLFMAVGRFWIDALMRKHMFYAVTDRRVIISSNWWNSTIQSMSLDKLSDISVSTRSDGGGTIRFGPLMAFYGWKGAVDWPGWPGWRSRIIPVFELASEAREVYQLIRDARQNTKQPT